MSEPKYDSTIARMAGNIAGALAIRILDIDPEFSPVSLARAVEHISNTAVCLARAIVAEVQRTEQLKPSADPVVAERERIVKFLQDVYNASTHGASTLMLHAIDAVQANNMSSPQAVARPEGKS